MTTRSIYKSQAGEQEIMAYYDKILANWPVPSDRITVPTRHGDTFILASGSRSAPPLVLLHGASSNVLSWIGDVVEYSRHFRVYAVDLPGEPGRSTQNRPSWHTQAYAEWMQDLLDSLKIRKVILVGLSQGGWTALKYAISRPEHVEKLVLLTPAGVIPVKTSFYLRAVLNLLLGRRGAEAINRLASGEDSLHPEAVRYLDVIMTYYRPRIGPMHMYTDRELRRLTMPVMLITGSKDPIQNTARVAARLKRLVPSLNHRLFPEKGHVLINLSGEIIPFLLDNK
ncbi:MAG: alpha/beta hydrolase [Dehalococcoidales bacterium]|nr:alpha/beta hydrolase [Dehalococcoidales bacterium]